MEAPAINRPIPVDEGDDDGPIRIRGDEDDDADDVPCPLPADAADEIEDPPPGCVEPEVSPSRAGAKKCGEKSPRGESQVDILVGFTHEAELFHNPEGAGYADIMVDGDRQTWRIRSDGFRLWLLQRFFQSTRGGPSSEAIQSAINVIEARARFGGSKRNVYLRAGECEGRIYLDLCNETWEAVEIDSSGWRVVQNPPIRFCRSGGMFALPPPASGGSIEALREFLNVRSDDDFVLAIAFILACLRGRSPYPVLVLSGEQGSAKSTFSAVVRKLVDPNKSALRALPRNEWDFFISATSAHVLAFDNLSGLSASISDTLCRLASGGGFSVRKLYSNQEEVLFEASRPIILNGIDDVVARSDLADRALFLTLDPISDDERRPEEELWAAFEQESPRILGALLDAVSIGLARLPHIKPDALPRMADFARWGMACETAFRPAGAFMAAYSGNRLEVVESVIEGDAVAAAVRALISERESWTGTATQLLVDLVRFTGNNTFRSKEWPTSPRGLAGRLKRFATFLRKSGISMTLGQRQGKTGTRMIHLTRGLTPARPKTAGLQPSASSASSAKADGPAFTVAPREPTLTVADRMTEHDGITVSRKDAGSRGG